MASSLRPSVRSCPLSTCSTLSKAAHTLAQITEQIRRTTGVEPERFYADKGYRGHNYAKPERVIISGRRRGLTPP